MIRPYTHKDRAAVLEILRLNIPRYFAPSEEQDFIEYLNKTEAYFVVSDNDILAGCGGYNILDKNTACLSWDFFHPDYQKQGYGSQLVNHRINLIKQLPYITNIVVRTSQFAYGFYARFGFELKETAKDFWAKGYDLYHMELSLK